MSSEICYQAVCHAPLPPPQQFLHGRDGVGDRHSGHIRYHGLENSEALPAALVKFRLIRCILACTIPDFQRRFSESRQARCSGNYPDPEI